MNEVASLFLGINHEYFKFNFVVCKDCLHLRVQNFNFLSQITGKWKRKGLTTWKVFTLQK